MADSFGFILNGRPVVVQEVSPNTTLLEYLRASGLTGSKEGCAEGDCGACSVAIIERAADGRPAYRAVNSCLMPVCLLAGREVVSVEGVGGSASMHPVQRTMAATGGSQCGYCTPGFICSLFEGYYRDDLHTLKDLDAQLAGNLCRCTGYRPIREAAREAFAERARQAGKNGQAGPDAFAERLKTDHALLAVDYECAGEKFFRPASLAELFHLRKENPSARLIAGATELGLEISKRYKKFPALISTESVAELTTISSTNTEWHIGGAVTLTVIEDLPGKEFPALGDMLHVFGSRQIRNRATMGGNIVTASPIGDSAPVLLSLDAQLVLASEAGERTVAIQDFFVAYRKTALRPEEVLKTIIIPRGISDTARTRKTAWFKVSKRREMDISTVAASFTLDLDQRNIVRHIRLAYGGVAALPARATKTETLLLGKTWDAKTIASVLPTLKMEFTPLSDVRGTAEYRHGLIADLLRKFLDQSAGLVAVPAGTSPALDLAPPTPNEFPPHESAHKHVTGEAMYVDDRTAGMLEVWPVCSPHARAKILKRDATAARQMPGIAAVLLAEDIPGVNDTGAVKQDEVLLADKEILFHSQIVALVVGNSQAACRAAAEKVIVEYEPLPPLFTIRDAITQGSFHNEPNFIRRGEAITALAVAEMTLEGDFELGGQEHFYLETQAAHAECGEDNSVIIASSSQHPSEVQHIVAHVLHLPMNQVVVQVPRMGGGFGGKETQAAAPAALAALAAYHTRKKVRVRLNRDQDMAITGHRHPFYARFKVGFTAGGKLQAAQVHLWSNGGWSQDLSQAVTDRALFHLDNCYYIPAVEFRGQVAKTHLSSNTAFRGFGGPQGMLVIEEIMDRIARRLGLPPEIVRERNLYHGTGATNTTHYGQEIEDNRIQTIWHELKKSAAFETRRQEIANWNTANPACKRGLAITPVKFGISFTVTHLNQAGAFALIYQDGTVQLNHGGTEMGQGLHTNMAMIASQELGIKLSSIRVMTTSTDKVPNTSATAASAGTDLNGGAVKNACETLRARLLPAAQDLLRLKSGREIALENIRFANGEVFEERHPEIKIPVANVVIKAYMMRISLSATGYYATPGIHWNRDAGRGRPFHYFANGAAVTEVEVDGFTGMHRVLRVDILHDVGDSVNAGINRGQIEGGFIQGTGWLTAEELKWNDKGVLLTHSPDTYKIPAIGDTPHEFNVSLLKNAGQKSVIHGSKAVGEPPLMLAISVREAIRDAIAAFGDETTEVPLPSPATCEAIWMAVQKVKRTSKTRRQTPEKLQILSAEV